MPLKNLDFVRGGAIRPSLIFHCFPQQQKAKGMYSQPVHVTPSSQELNERRLSPQNIERALYALHFHGFVILRNVVDHAHLDILNGLMVTEAACRANLGVESVAYNYHKGTGIVIPSALNM
jgi:hypothetical protein